MENYSLSAEENQRIYAQDIRDFIFSKATPIDKPMAIIVGGQPGAGKSNILDLSRVDLNKNAAIINGDDLRQFHPMDKTLYQRFGLSSSQLTHPDSAVWSIKGSNEAAENKYNIILESTLRDKNICKSIEQLQDAGYDVQVRYVAVNGLESLASVYQRFIDQAEQYKESSSDVNNVPRLTPPEWHNQAYRGGLETLEEIQQSSLCPIAIYNRKGECLYNSQNENEMTAAEKVEEVRNAVWDTERLQRFVFANENIVSWMAENHIGQDHIDVVKSLGVCPTEAKIFQYIAHIVYG